MRIGVLGTGVVGRTLAERLVGLGHEVALGTRDPQATRGRSGGAWFAEHPDVRLLAYPAAAAEAELVVNATPGAVSLAVIEQLGARALAGKVLLDVANPLDFSAGFPPTLLVKDTDSLAEQLQRAAPEARVVKALNTMNCAVMVDPGRVAGPHEVFVAGNDPAAKAQVGVLLQDFGWDASAIVDLGELAAARGLEMYLPLWITLMGRFGTADFNLHVAR